MKDTPRNPETGYYPRPDLRPFLSYALVLRTVFTSLPAFHGFLLIWSMLWFSSPPLSVVLYHWTVPFPNRLQTIFTYVVLCSTSTLGNCLIMPRRRKRAIIDRPPNSPGHRRPRPRGSPQHDLHRVSPLHWVVENSKAFAVLGPKILQWTIKDSVHPTLLCFSAASSRVCNGGQHPNTEGGYEPTW